MNDLSIEFSISDPIVRKAIYVAYNGQCFYTGRQVKFEDMHIDHIIPKSKGGTSTLDNFVLSCATINLGKHNKTMPPFTKVVSEIVKLIFLPKVLIAMEEMGHNAMISNNMTCLNDRMREKKIDFHSLMWGKIRGRVMQRGKHNFPFIRHGKKIYYYISDIDPIINQVKQEG